jgi:hypothetical protein
MGLSDAVFDIKSSYNPTEEEIEAWLIGKNERYNNAFWSGYVNGFRSEPYPNPYKKGSKEWFCFNYGECKAKD